MEELREEITTEERPYGENRPDDDLNDELNRKLRQYFDGKIVRKDLTKHIKEGANVPVYVLEYLLGQYCNSEDEQVINEGVDNVKRILANNYVRPDEAQKVLSALRERGAYTVIDKITVNLNIKKDRYEAEFSNLGIKNIPINSDYPKQYDRLLAGGIWCIIQLDYEYIEEEKDMSPIHIRKLTPVQMPHIDMDELKNGRKAFTKDEWITILLRSTGMEATKLAPRAQWLLLARMLPLVENNLNLCELGPRSTGKSHLYKEISPNSILVSGGQTTVANLFYNMSNKTVGLVGMWDCVAFDEVAGIQCEENNTIEEMVAYYRLSHGCVRLVEKTLGEKVDFDPLGRISSSQIELIKCAVEIDKLIHKKDPIVEALERAVEEALSEDKDGAEDKDGSDTQSAEAERELFKEDGDGSDLEDEHPVELFKEPGDGSDLPDNDENDEPHYSDAALSAMDELNALIGLDGVKTQVQTMVNVLKVRKRCAELNVRRPAISLHMVFTGNPGTGKTTVARILGKIYKEAGLLSKGHFVEASRAELVEKYVGHTAIKVKQVFEKAKGGILFIDEAYALTSEGDSFGQEAVETLLKLMENNRDDIAVIVAGYPALMQDFLESNPGLRSRFPFVIEFPDYSGDELTQIFKCFCADNDIVASRSVLNVVNAHFEREASKKTRNYGNARAVRNYFEKMIMNQANRLVRNELMERDDLCRFEREDIPNTLKIKPMTIPKQRQFTVV